MRVALIAAVLFLVALGTVIAVGTQETVVEVDMSPSCNCCEKWVSYMQQHGFKVQKADLTRKVVPLPIALFASTCPSWSSTRCLTIGSPSPVPSIWAVVEESTR